MLGRLLWLAATNVQRQSSFPITLNRPKTPYHRLYRRRPSKAIGRPRRATEWLGKRRLSCTNFLATAPATKWRATKVYWIALRASMALGVRSARERWHTRIGRAAKEDP